MLYSFYFQFQTVLWRKWICGPSQNCWKWYEKLNRVRKKYIWSFHISDFSAPSDFIKRPTDQNVPFSIFQPSVACISDLVDDHEWAEAQTDRRSGSSPFNPALSSPQWTLRQPAFRSHPPVFSHLRWLCDTWTPSLATGPLQKRASRPSPVDNQEVPTHSYKPPSTCNIKVLSIFLSFFLCSGCPDIKIKANDAVVSPPKKTFKKTASLCFNVVIVFVSVKHLMK